MKISARFAALSLLAFGLILTACDSIGGEDDEDEDPTAVAEQEAVDAVKQAIENKGWEIPSKSSGTAQVSTKKDNEPTILDYIETDVQDSGARQVYMLVGLDGQIIPNSEWQSDNQNRCIQESLRYLKAAKKRFSFDMFDYGGDYLVKSQYIDIQTGKIEEQQDAEHSSLVEATTNAWDKIQNRVAVKEPADYCGDKISNITLTFNSITRLEHIPDAGDQFSSTVKEEVKAEIELTYEEKDGMYVGSGDLEWANFDHSEEDCDLPPPAQVKVHKFVYRNPATENGDTELQIQFRDMKRASCGESYGIYPDFSFSWWLLHRDEIHKKVELDNYLITIEYIYALHDWEAVEASPVTQKQYDHSNTIEDEDATYNLSGESTLRILHEPGQ